jgi:hypothetical protein
MNQPTPKRIVLICGCILLACAVVAWVVIPSNRARRTAERTRQKLRAEGFKLALKEFALSSSAEQRARADVLLRAGRLCAGILPLAPIDLLRPTASNAAIVLHAQERFPANGNVNSWPALAASVDRAGGLLDDACAATGGGLLRFESSTGSGGEFVVFYLTDLRSLAAALAARTLVELHRSSHSVALTNLLALTRLATEWDIEPIEQAHYLRFFLADAAERTLWQSLHSPGWTEPELALLQREWQRPEFFRGLPEAIACSRAAIFEQQEREARQPYAPQVSLRQIMNELFSSPLNAANQVQGRIVTSRYQKYGIYEEQTQTLLFYRDLEVNFRNAVQAGSWAEMRAIPGVTNNNAARAGGVVRNGIRTAPRAYGYRQGPGLIRRAAETETARRLAVTALALERFRLRHGSYPNSLEELAPEFLPAVPADFMDGKPLRYRPLRNVEFVLYSAGLDCMDDGGVMMRLELPGSSSYGSGFSFRGGRREGPDMLWPRAATTEEAQIEMARMETVARPPPVPPVAFPR